MQNKALGIWFAGVNIPLSWVLWMPWPKRALLGTGWRGVQVVAPWIELQLDDQQILMSEKFESREEIEAQKFDS